MSLDEWKQMQEKERVKSSFELRKPGEGEKKGLWKDTKVLKKMVGEDDEQFAARRVSPTQQVNRYGPCQIVRSFPLICRASLKLTLSGFLPETSLFSGTLSSLPGCLENE